MKLREHPLLKKHWPPKWRPFFGSTAPVGGEIGVLDEVRPSVLSDRCCFVRMDLRGKKYIAGLSFDDDGFCRKFIDLVRRQRGKPIISAIRDITERKQIQAQLQEKERLATLGTTAAVFAHEIANPLNGIATSLELATSELENTDNAFVYDSVTTAYQEIQRLTLLLKAYRSFARPQRLQLQPTDLRPIIREALTTIVRGFNGPEIRLDLELEENVPFIDTDKQKLKQVVLNLGKNAIEAMPNGGVLSAKVYQQSGRVVLEIADTGIGIAEDDDVFQLFRTTKPDGTGLGLPIVQQIVSEHRGSIDYTSALRKGTTFKISLPIN